MTANPITRKETTRPLIRLRGCDDSTWIPAEVFTPEELEVVRKLALWSVDIGGGCAPTVHLGQEYEITRRREDGSTYSYESFEDELDPGREASP